MEENEEALKDQMTEYLIKEAEKRKLDEDELSEINEKVMKVHRYEQLPGGFSPMTLAPAEVEHYLWEAIESIDEKLGDGYAAKHPELLGAFIQACGTNQLANTYRLHMLRQNKELDF